MPFRLLDNKLTFLYHFKNDENVYLIIVNDYGVCLQCFALRNRSVYCLIVRKLQVDRFHLSALTGRNELETIRTRTVDYG